MAERQYDQVDKTRYAIVLKGPVSGSGYDEIMVRTVMRKDAERILRERLPDARDRRAFKIEKVRL